MKGENLIFTETYIQERPKLLALARRMGAFDPEDAVQDAYTVSVRILNRLDRKHRPAALLHRLTERAAIRQYRSHQRRREFEAPVGLLPELEAVEAERDNLVVPTLTSEGLRFAEDFDDAVRELEEDDRDAFILTELRGLTVREAGDVLDTSHMTTHRRTERARLSIREEIA